MKRRLNPVVVGAFVLGAILLAAAALLSFGAGRWFDDPYRFVIMIREGSVSGLDVGSPVKLSGVRIGRVESVTARYDRDSEKVVVRVVSDFDEASARELLGGDDQTAGLLVRELILDGLHAKLNFSGITGMLYIELMLRPPQDVDEALAAQVEYEKITGYPIVPMAPSLLAEFTDSFSAITSGLARVDYAGISTELRSVLTNLNRALGGLDLKHTTGSIEAAAGAVETLANNPELGGAFAALNAGLGEMRALLAAWREATPGLRDDATAAIDAATKALTEVQETAAAATTMLQSRREIPDEFAATLASLQRAADAIERLAEYLERNPSALLRGRASTTPAKE